MTQLTDKDSRCVVCGSANIAGLMTLNGLPAHSSVVFGNRAKAEAVARGAIRIHVCKDCTHMFNSAFNPTLVDDNPDNDNSPDHSSTFRGYASALAAYLVNTYGLRQKTVLDIGCGNGTFLKLLCRLGANQGYGFDSGAPPNSQMTQAERIVFVHEFDSESFSHLKPDFVCCRHTLEHMQRPIEFLSMLRRSLQASNDPVVFFEVANAGNIVRTLGIWDISHEHCSYYSANSLETAFLMSGYEVIAVNELYGRQSLSIEARPSGKEQSAPRTTHSRIADDLEHIYLFGTAYRDRIEQWQRVLEDISRRAQRAVIWGAGAKGITFLNLLAAGASVDCVVDLNPRKTGFSIPGTGHPIVPPETLRENPPDVVIVMNKIYFEEIRRILSNLNLQPEILVA